MSLADLKTLISVEEARRLILEQVELQPVDRVSLTDSVGYTLARTVESTVTIPPFDNSAMDGYAVRTADLTDVPTRLRVVEDLPAGAFPERTVEPGTCSRIMTGAPFPDGADAVVPVEWTATRDGERDVVQINRAPQPAQHVRRAGRDVRPGQQIFEAGHVITPPTVGMLGTIGVAEVSVRRRPSVAVIATGDELVDIAEAPDRGQIRNANGPALAAQTVSAGGRVVAQLLARDDEADLRSKIGQALEADVLLFSGGVSVGEYDFVKAVLDDLGMEMLFWKVRQRPGKPLAFGLLGHRLVFGLPGNPVSSAVCFEQYVRPALATMLGRMDITRPLVSAILDEPIRKSAGLYHFVRGQVRTDEQGRPHVRTTGPQGSNLYSSFAFADCLIHLPESLKDPEPGVTVLIEHLLW